MSDSVVSIGRNAFFSCDNLIEVSSLDGVTSIGGGAFACTPWLTEKTKENPFVMINGILIDGRTCVGDIVIPDTVTNIAGNAFSTNKEITSVTIPASVTSIDVAAFYNCRNLLTVKMTDSVTEIGMEAFKDCIKLKNIRLSKSLKVIECWTFANCIGLTKITIPDSVNDIDMLAFRRCKNLKYLIISNEVTSIISDDSGDPFPYLTIYGLKNSYIQSFAKDNKIQFKILAMNVTKKNLAVGDTYSLKMNSQAICSWKSSNKSIATVDSNGKITAKKKGKVTITATLYEKKYQCVVTIK
jgi:hypothetical protein